jgi:hypothetical protein
MKEFERHQRVAALQLTDQQKLFAERYVEHFNKSRAVRESGSKALNYSAIQRVYEDMLARTNVLAYIEILKEDAASRVDLRLDRVLKEQMRIGFSRMDHFVTWTEKGVKLKGSKELSEDDLAAVQEIVQTETTTGTKIRVKLHPKQPALDQLLKYVDGHDGDQKKGDKGGPKKLVQNNVTINGALMDPASRKAIEILSNRLFKENGKASVPVMTPAMQARVEALTASRLVEYAPASEIAPGAEPPVDSHGEEEEGDRYAIPEGE